MMQIVEGLADDDRVYVHKWLRATLDRNNIKQSLLAWEIHVHSSIINLWSKGTRPVAHDKLAPLAAALSALIGGEEEVTVAGIVNRSDIVKGERSYQRVHHPVSPSADCGHAAKVAASIQRLMAETPPHKPIDGVIPLPALPPIPKSTYPLLWCESDHGTGVHRRHHHGPAPAWAPRLGDIREAS